MDYDDDSKSANTLAQPLKVTVANWLTPNGNHITDVGLDPDVEIEKTTEDFDQELDPQLDKALELVKDL